MAAMKASSSTLRATQRTSGPRPSAARPFTSAARSAASKPILQSWQLRAVTEEVEETVEVTIDAADADAVMRAVLRDAGIERAFLEDTADADTSAYLSALEAEAADLDEDDGSGLLEAVIGDVVGDEATDAGVASAEVLEEELPRSYLTEEDQEPDVLTGMDNAAAVQALRVVDALKLSRQELESVVPPKEWDSDTVDWFAGKKSDELPLPEYRLNLLWTDKNIAVAVDQVYARGGVSPLTEYFFWPRKDAWEELRQALEARPWVSETDKVVLLNRLTEIINFWQEFPEGEARPTLDSARATFGDCTFAGTLSSA